MAEAIKSSQCNRRRTGFTLLEALAAAVLLALGVATVFSISSRSLGQAHRLQQRDTAWDILHRQLTLIDAAGITAFVEQGQTSGEVEQTDTTYYWRATVYEEPLDQLYQVEMIVSWESAGRTLSVRAGTMMNGEPGAAVL